MFACLTIQVSVIELLRMKRSSAAPLAHEAKKRILLVVPTTFAWAQRIVQGFIAYAHEHRPDWELLFAPGHDPLRVTWFGQADAVLYHGSESQVEIARRQTNGPVVLVEQPSFDGLAAVRTDDERIAQCAFDHLSARGFVNFAYWGPHSDDFSRRRGRAFESQVKQARLRWLGVPPVPHWRPDKPWDASELVAWFREQPKPLALFAASDSTAARVIHACVEAQIPVPDDVAVLGVDNDILLCESLMPGLSSVDHNCIAVGATAAAAIDNAMRSGKPPQSRRITPLGVIERQSTARVIASDPQVVKALELIRRRASRGWSAIDIINRVGSTRRRFELLFRKQTGTTLQDALREARFEHAMRLLADSEMSLIRVAIDSGFSSAAYFTRAFRARTGVTPTEYRRRARHGDG
jgi:LacI family transcriptional regulator